MQAWSGQPVSWGLWRFRIRRAQGSASSLARVTFLAAALTFLAVLAGCGGGSSSGGNNSSGGAAGCSTAEQNVWLRDYFAQSYFWNRLAPRPDPSPYGSLSEYFAALLYAGGDPAPALDPAPASTLIWPADKWSNFQPTVSYSQFFTDGQSLGWGISVAGLEVAGLPSAPLYVRYVEPKSPAALAGVVRGDQVLSINGRLSPELIATNDFSALTSTATGQVLTLGLRNAAGDRTVQLVSQVFDLTPLSMARVVTTSQGKKVGYLVLKDMINQLLTPLEMAMADFKSQGVSELVLDLRYNGGGYVSVANTIASYVAGTSGAGKVFASLRYNDLQSSSNSLVRMSSPAPSSALGLQRVYVLMGRRTCSASEMVINGLRGVGVQVVGLGETSCGKPFGFQPVSQCGNTFSVVNFESVNAQGQGRYFDGLTATCPVAEDWKQTLGQSAEPLLMSALYHADRASCPLLATSSPASRAQRRVLEPNEMPFMVR